MGDGRRRAPRPWRWPLPVLVAALTLGPAVTGIAEPTTTGEPIRFEAGPDTVLELDDGRRFLDTVEVRLAPDGSPVLINELGMDAYLAGVAEMPPRWHGEALKAQAVAARTYAWRSVDRGTFEDRGLGYDICGTVACQVFTGTEVVEESSFGARWRQAVEETSDEVLLEEDGGPILARYFSSSGGRTLANELVFPDTGSYPYLVGVDDPDDEISPTHRWRATFTREQLDDVLGRGERLAAAVPLADIERDGDVLDPHAEVVVTGRDGASVRIAAQTFREFVSRIAPQRHPDDFPGPREDGARPLPATLPSSRFAFEVSDEEVVVAGRGWGHGVGLSQHGAHGRARRGEAYDEILAAYYNGLTPTRTGDVPERVRVGLDLAEAAGVRAEGPVRVVVGDQPVAEGSLGGWSVQATDGALSLRPPEGRDDELEVGATERAGGALDGDEHVAVEATVNKPVRLRLEVRDADDGLVVRRDLGVADPGTHGATWRYDDEEGGPVGRGRYQVALVGVDEHDARDGEPVTVAVEARDERSGTDGGVLGSGPLAVLLSTPVLSIATLLALLAIVAGARGLSRSRP